MFNYSPAIMRTAKNYNIQERDVLFCYLIAAGIDRADAHFVIYNRTTKQDRATIDAHAAELIRNNPGIKVLIQKIKAKKTINTVDAQQDVRETINAEREEKEGGGEKLATRSGVAQKMRVELSNLHGKEAVAGLMTLAKLEGYDKEQDRKEEEKRRYFLPWRSKCRGCKLMRIFRELSLTESEQTGKAPTK